MLVDLKFTVNGRSKQAYTHTHAQCSHASMGLDQAGPNKHVADIRREGEMQEEKMKREETEEAGETAG